jgi:hypothetical protein
MRLLLAAYAIVVTLIATFLGSNLFPAPLQFETTRLLPKNHRIVPGDVRVRPGYHRGWDLSGRTVRDFEGKYASAVVGKGMVLDRSSVRDEPSLTAPNSVSTLLWIPEADASPADRGRLEPGATVDVCGLADAKAPCIDGAPVASRWCDPAAPASCSVGLWIPNDKRNAVLQALDQTGAPKKAPVRLVSVKEAKR